MIETYANYLARRNIAQIKYEELMQRKEELYQKYFNIASKTSEVTVHTNEHRDKMAEYMSELMKIDPITNLCLDDAIKEARNERDRLNYYVKRIEYEIDNLKGIEYELFDLIAVKGYIPTRAVQKIANKFEKEEQTIWKVYYPRIKDSVEICVKKFDTLH